uniref:Putative secreted protein n=1 Tax=Ixodes ricinus TaxID=34613 RepID=A0A147BFL1_IXORI
MRSTKYRNQILVSLPVLFISTSACCVTIRSMYHEPMFRIQIFEKHNNLLIQSDAKGGLASDRIVCLLKDVGFLHFNFHFFFRGIWFRRICVRRICFRRTCFRRNYFRSSYFEGTSKYFPRCIERSFKLR